VRRSVAIVQSSGMAGLWELWEQQGEAIESCTIIKRADAANPRADAGHHRPVDQATRPLKKSGPLNIRPPDLTEGR
jgi:hypothetical protein